LGRLVVWHVDCAQDVGVALRSNLRLGHAVAKLNSLVLENVTDLLLFSELPVGLRGVGLKFFWLLTWLQVNMLLDRVCGAQNILDFFSGLLLLELHGVTT